MEISVIMSVYNTKNELLREAIESILEQSYKEFEFIIIDDGSNLETVEVLENYRDSRIIIIHNQENIGLTKSLNVGLKHAKGKYVARMDADDISYKSRLEKQYLYMEEHKDIDILGSWVDEEGKTERCGGTIPTEWRKVRMLFGNHGIVHSTAFMRREFLERHGIQYNENIKKSQDYKLWIDCMCEGAKIAVYPEKLVLYRRHAAQISNAQGSEQAYYARMIREELLRDLYPEVLQEQLQQFLYPDKQILREKELMEMFWQMEEHNHVSNKYNAKVLHYELMDYWKVITGKYRKIEWGYMIYRVKRSCAKRGWRIGLDTLNEMW